MSEVRFGPGGVPDWLEPMVRFCSRCGIELRFGPIAGEERDRLACPSCGFIFYVNPRLVVTTLPITDRGEVILIRRGIDPGYDMWAQPGGFLEIDETVRDAAIRETLEETGLLVEPGRIVGLYSRVPAAVVMITSRRWCATSMPTACTICAVAWACCSSSAHCSPTCRYSTTWPSRCVSTPICRRA